MVIAYWSIYSYYIKYMIYAFTLCKETNCGKFISVYQHLYRDMYYNTPFPHNVLSIVKVACSIGEKLSRVFISFIRGLSHSSHWWAKPFVALVSKAFHRIAHCRCYCHSRCCRHCRCCFGARELNFNCLMTISHEIKISGKKLRPLRTRRFARWHVAWNCFALRNDVGKNINVMITGGAWTYNWSTSELKEIIVTLKEN